jgi:teichuronic acid biosynthesis glycosyltransferase TuaG
MNIGISILMPIYNGIEFIEESVKSIIIQSYTEWELIIGINGHPENSDVYKIASKFKNDKIKVLDLYTIRGKSDALNEMIKYSSNDWIALLDVDDFWLPEKLESQIPYMEEYDVIGTHCKYFGDLNISPNIPIGDISNFNFLSVNPIINSSCLLKKELAQWNNTLNGVEDYDLWIRLWKLKKKFYNVNSIQIHHRIHKNSSFNSKGNNLSAKKLLERYI